MSKAIFWLILSIVVIPLLLLMPTISIDSAAVITSNAYAYIRSAVYFLPIVTVAQIIFLIISLWIVRILIAFIRMIWGVLPVGK